MWHDETEKGERKKRGEGKGKEMVERFPVKKRRCRLVVVML